MTRLRNCLGNRRGTAMLVALCLGAIVLALSASLLTAAAQAGAAEGTPLAREQAYQLALSFSRRLDAELCGTPSGSFATFIQNTFLGDAYADDTPYSFTAANSGPSDPYGQITVTLQRGYLPPAEQTWPPDAAMTPQALARQLDAFEAAAADSADWLVSVTVTARTETAEFSYTQTYVHRTPYPVVYTVDGRTCRRRPGTLQFDCEDGAAEMLDLSETDPAERGAVTACCDPAGPSEGGRFENLAERGR